MTEPLCPHGHPAYGCPGARIEWDPLQLVDFDTEVTIVDEPTFPAPLNVRRDATLILLGVLAIVGIAVIAWSAR